MAIFKEKGIECTMTSWLSTQICTQFTIDCEFLSLQFWLTQQSCVNFRDAFSIASFLFLGYLEWSFDLRMVMQIPCYLALAYRPVLRMILDSTRRLYSLACPVYYHQLARMYNFIYSIIHLPNSRLDRLLRQYMDKDLLSPFPRFGNASR